MSERDSELGLLSVEKLRSEDRGRRGRLLRRRHC